MRRDDKSLAPWALKEVELLETVFVDCSESDTDYIPYDIEPDDDPLA